MKKSFIAAALFALAPTSIALAHHTPEHTGPDMGNAADTCVMDEVTSQMEQFGGQKGMTLTIPLEHIKKACEEKTGVAVDKTQMFQSFTMKW